PRVRSGAGLGFGRERALFFFQAEDGIRDFHVTGVQTCALPISSSRPVSTAPAQSTSAAPAKRRIARLGGRDTLAPSVSNRRRRRSEERRVGKECGARGAPAP